MDFADFHIFVLAIFSNFGPFWTINFALGQISEHVYFYSITTLPTDLNILLTVFAKSAIFKVSQNHVGTRISAFYLHDCNTRCYFAVVLVY